MTVPTPAPQVPAPQVCTLLSVLPIVPATPVTPVAPQASAPTENELFDEYAAKEAAAHKSLKWSLQNKAAAHLTYHTSNPPESQLQQEAEGYQALSAFWYAYAVRTFTDEVNEIHHIACVFCAAPDWFVAPIAIVDVQLMRDHTCKECGRTARWNMNMSHPRPRMELVQTGGDNPPEWLLPVIPRLRVQAAQAPAMGVSRANFIPILSLYGTAYESLQQHIDRSGGVDACWPWLAYINRQGYGQFKFEGKQWLLPRLIYTMEKKPIPERHVVRQTCQHKLCCNPAHLYLETDTDARRKAALNAIADALLKGTAHAN